MSDQSPESFDNEKMAVVMDFLANGGTLAEANDITEQALEATYHMAYNQYTNGHYEEAARGFQYLCFYNQWNPRYFISLGACQQMLKVYGQAIETFTYASRLDPENPLPLVYIGDSYNALHQEERARLAYTAATLLAKKIKFSHKEVSRAENLLFVLEENKKEDI